MKRERRWPLVEAGARVEVHDDHLARDAPDEEWIALVGERGWIAVTKDKNIRYRANEIAAIKLHRARVLVLRAKNATGGDMADLLVGAQRRIERFVASSSVPFVAGIDRSGRIEAYEI